MRRGLFLSAALAIALSGVAVAPAAQAAFPGQNGRIAYVTTAGDHKAIYTVDAQGADPQPLIDLGSGRDAINPAWSWDGQSIAFAGQTSPGGLFVIYVANADGTGTPQQITDRYWEPGISSSDTDPTWEPYGEHIAFVRTLDDGVSTRSGIWRVELATGSTTAVYMTGDLDLAEPAWSPDGTRIAFTGRLASCAQEPCRWGIGIWDVEHARFTNPLNYNASYDWHHPDWSPDGTLIVAAFGYDEVPIMDGMSLQLFDVSSGYPVDSWWPCHLTSEPSFSPDGQWLLLTATPVNNETGEREDPILCTLRMDRTSGGPLEGSPPRSDAAWGIVPGSAPPSPDRTPPTIEFRPDPSTSDWLDASLAGSVHIVATDDRSPPSIACTDNGEPLSLSAESSGSTTDAVATLAEGYRNIDCTATDGAGNSTAGSATYQVDLTPPTVPRPYLSHWPTVLRVGEPLSLAASADDFGSGVRSLDVRVEGHGAVPPTEWENSGYSASLTASFVPTRPDLSNLIVSARDNVGWVSETAVPIVSYDPSAGSSDGRGWIVPGGPTSEPGDVLPGLDGVRKASFGFTAKYKAPSSEVRPAGTLTFSYGSRFKLQSSQLSWLAVRDEGTAYLGGFASIQGMGGEFPFVAVIIDGASTASPDRFELRVYELGTVIASPTPLFAASGDVGGQIQIRS
jgi:dipeptidyl aminopeptidase/acylaminoacyl peptidase